jgi:hypothetical protein
MRHLMGYCNRTALGHSTARRPLGAATAWYRSA